ncbi:MAG TPA: FAD-dependent oxidoreductase [Candidatus Sulfotelmatobacter sp.]|nr:FAD-dependent oxidoreductase [Candidatus Sulfotelmatobacter sp.]
MATRVIVVGGGVGGTLAANLISKELSSDAKVTVVDPTGMHVYQPGFLYVALGQANGRWLAQDERHLLRRSVEMVIDRAVRIDPAQRTVTLGRGGRLDYDFLVLATGARLAGEEIPGLVGGAHDFYSLEGAIRLREALRAFPGGRIVMGVAGIPYKCPPAPVEFVFMLEQYLHRRGIREKSTITLASPLNRAFTIETTSKVVQPILEQRGIELATFFNVEAVLPDRKVVTSIEGEELPYDLLVLVPPHRGAQMIEDSGLGDERGWVPVSRATLQHEKFDTIFAIGDATNLPISKSGSTAHFEAPVVASQIAARVRGTTAKENYGGRVMCFLETGHSQATTIRFDYDHPPVSPNPSPLWHVAKWAFNRAYWVTVPQGRVA